MFITLLHNIFITSFILYLYTIYIKYDMIYMIQSVAIYNFLGLA